MTLVNIRIYTHTHTCDGHILQFIMPQIISLHSHTTCNTKHT